MKLRELLREVSTQSYDYGCVMVYFNFPEIGDLHSRISSQDIYTEDEDESFGLEDEPHCTLLYGLHKEVPLSKVTSIVSKYPFSKVRAYNVSLFKNKKYDVLKFDIQGENLDKVNKSLQQLPFTSEYDEYHPHLTIGYLKPGTGVKYVNIFKELEYVLDPTHCVYSQPNGIKSQIKVKIKM